MATDELRATAELRVRSSACPLRCGYRYPIPACVRLHLIQHHDYGYDEAQKAYPDICGPCSVGDHMACRDCPCDYCAEMREEADHE